ncbi:MAG: DUF374 domain-containing protein [Chlamydia sp.]
MIRFWIRSFLFLVGSLFLRIYLRTLRIQIALPEEFKRIHAVYAIWHDSLFIIPRIRHLFSNRKSEIHIMISKSRDGEFAAFFAEQFSYMKAIRVSHTARFTALKSAISTLKEGHSILITPDGPRGPRRKIKGGIITASSASDRPIIPIAVQYHWAISLSSWDRFQIPIPFSRIDIQFGRLITPSEEISPEETIERDLSFSIKDQ